MTLWVRLRWKLWKRAYSQELTAAVLATSISLVLKREMGLSLIPFHYWTDSQVVLGYLNNEKVRYKRFVAIRIFIISAHSRASTSLRLPPAAQRPVFLKTGTPHFPSKILGWHCCFTLMGHRRWKGSSACGTDPKNCRPCEGWPPRLWTISFVMIFLPGSPSGSGGPSRITRHRHSSPVASNPSAKVRFQELCTW